VPTLWFVRSHTSKLGEGGLKNGADIRPVSFYIRFFFVTVFSVTNIKLEIFSKRRFWCCKMLSSYCYRPGQTFSFPGVRVSQISRQSAHEGGKVVSLTHRPPLPSRKCSW